MTDEQLSNLPRQKIAMLIDGDNAQPSLLPQMLVEASALWTGHCQTNLRRLDDGQYEFLERDVELPRLPAHPAVPVHHRQERHRQRHDHRCDGHFAFGRGGRILSGLIRQRLHAARHTHPRDRNFCDGHRGEENSQAFCQRLRCFRLHRKFGGGDESRTSAIITAKINFQSETQERSRPDAFAGASLRYGGSRGRLGAARLDGQRSLST